MCYLTCVQAKAQYVDHCWLPDGRMAICTSDHKLMLIDGVQVSGAHNQPGGSHCQQQAPDSSLHLHQGCCAYAAPLLTDWGAPVICHAMLQVSITMELTKTPVTMSALPDGCLLIAMTKGQLELYKPAPREVGSKGLPSLVHQASLKVKPRAGWHPPNLVTALRCLAVPGAQHRSQGC